VEAGRSSYTCTKQTSQQNKKRQRKSLHIDKENNPSKSIMTVNICVTNVGASNCIKHYWTFWNR
jgi:hypothetical protein